MDARFSLIKAKRIVVKVGTSTLTHTNGSLNLSIIEELTRVLADLSNTGKEIILVTSGAIGVGHGLLGYTEKPKTVKERQALAAVGQCQLMHIYSKFFKEYNLKVGQILLTRNVVEEGTLEYNVTNTFETLISMRVIPIVNENDSVATEEIEFGVFGDNDTLAAIVSRIVKADLLILLSDIDGLYSKDPRIDKSATLLSLVPEITLEIEESAGFAGSNLGTGGMFTKINAAKIATKAGVDMVIANGKDPGIISEIIFGNNIGTLFVAKKEA